MASKSPSDQWVKKTTCLSLDVRFIAAWWAFYGTADTRVSLPTAINVTPQQNWRISNYIHDKVRDEITHPFGIFNGATV